MIGPQDPLLLDVPASLADFDEAGYLSANPDVAGAVDPRDPARFPSGRSHFEAVGHTEGRAMRRLGAMEAMRARKMDVLRPRLRRWQRHQRRGSKFDFLTDALRRETGVEATTNVSANPYDPYVLELIGSCRGGLVLDCGAGRRDRYFSNVVNYDVVDYDTTDVVGPGERLPFKSGTFDGVLSLAVLEHVRDPFACAAEIARVLKPGGRLLCSVPFLQPFHAYPHHYYNMTAQGVRALFERRLVIDDQQVVDFMLPVWSLTWIVQSWAAGLPDEARQEFLKLTIADLQAPAHTLLEQPWVRALPAAKNFELAAATMLWARKPARRP